MSFSTLKELEAALLQQMEKSSSLEKQVKLLRSLYDRLLKSVRDKDAGAFSHAVTDGVYCELHDLSKLNEKDLDLNHQALRRVVEAAISIRYKELKEGFPLAVQEEVTKRLAAKNKELDEAFPKAVQSEVTRLLAEKNKELEKSFHKAVRDGIREGFDIEKERLQRKFEECVQAKVTHEQNQKKVLQYSLTCGVEIKPEIEVSPAATATETPVPIQAESESKSTTIMAGDDTLISQNKKLVSQLRAQATRAEQAEKNYKALESQINSYKQEIEDEKKANAVVQDGLKKAQEQEKRDNKHIVDIEAKFEATQQMLKRLEVDLVRAQEQIDVERKAKVAANQKYQSEIGNTIKIGNDMKILEADRLRLEQQVATMDHEINRLNSLPDHGPALEAERKVNDHLSAQLDMLQEEMAKFNLRPTAYDAPLGFGTDQTLDNELGCQAETSSDEDSESFEDERSYTEGVLENDQQEGTFDMAFQTEPLREVIFEDRNSRGEHDAQGGTQEKYTHPDIRRRTRQSENSQPEDRPEDVQQDAEHDLNSAPQPIIIYTSAPTSMHNPLLCWTSVERRFAIIFGVVIFSALRFSSHRLRHGLPSFGTQMPLYLANNARPESRVDSEHSSAGDNEEVSSTRGIVNREDVVRDDDIGSEKILMNMALTSASSASSRSTDGPRSLDAIPPLEESTVPDPRIPMESGSSPSGSRSMHFVNHPATSTTESLKPPVVLLQPQTPPSPSFLTEILTTPLSSVWCLSTVTLIFYFSLHLLLYTGIYLVWQAYRHGDVWLAANENTRVALLHLMSARKGGVGQGYLHFVLSELWASKIEYALWWGLGGETKGYRLPG